MALPSVLNNLSEVTLNWTEDDVLDDASYVLKSLSEVTLNCTEEDVLDDSSYVLKSRS
jgi:hypothetical protein